MKTIDPNKPVLIAGPCVIESRTHAWDVAQAISDATGKYPELQWVFKASYDKANRTDMDSFRTIGTDSAMRVIKEIGEKLDVAVTSDVHTPSQAREIGPKLDVIQIPAFLSRQTDILVSAAIVAKTINVKKMQTMAPGDVKHIVNKIRRINPKVDVIVTERGNQFGYGNVVIDFRRFAFEPKGYNHCVDITHTISHWVESWPLLFAACACGVHIIFAEVGSTKCDADRAIPINKVGMLVDQMWARVQIAKHTHAPKREDAK